MRCFVGLLAFSVLAFSSTCVFSAPRKQRIEMRGIVIIRRHRMQRAAVKRRLVRCAANQQFNTKYRRDADARHHANEVEGTRRVTWSTC